MKKDNHLAFIKAAVAKAQGDAEKNMSKGKKAKSGLRSAQRLSKPAGEAGSKDVEYGEDNTTADISTAKLDAYATKKKRLVPRITLDVRDRTS